MRQKLRLMRSADAFAEAMAARKFCFGDKGGGDAPDMEPVARASEEAAKISAKLGREQLAENKRQYDQNYAVTKPVVDAQLGLMKQTKAQGDDYYNYGKTYRPAEQAMMADAFGVSGDQLATYNAMLADANAKAQAQFDAQQAARRTELMAQISSAERDSVAQQAVAAKTSANLRDANGQLYDATATSGWKKLGTKDLRILNQTYRFDHRGSGALWRATDPTALQKAGYVAYKDVTGALHWVKPTSNSESTSTTSTSSRADELRKRLDALDAEKFDASTVDASTANAYQAKTILDASNAQRAKEQAVVDQQAAQDAADSARITQLIGASDASIYDQNRGEIETEVGTAVADARNGYSSSVNQALRQGMRYGFSPAKLASMTGSTAMQNAQQVAAAANGTRTAATGNVRNRLVSSVQTGMGLRNTNFARNRGYATQDKATAWAKQLDAVGLAKGMPGASQGAYSLANQSGNSAVANQNATSGQYVSGMNAGTGTIMAGQQAKIQGLSNVMNAQTSIYNNSGGSDATGSVIGAAGGIAAAMI